MVARRECAVPEVLRVDASIDPYSVGADSISARGPCHCRRSGLSASVILPFGRGPDMSGPYREARF